MGLSVMKTHKYKSETTSNLNVPKDHYQAAATTTIVMSVKKVGLAEKH